MKSGKRRVYVPDRGDIVKLSFDPQEGHEQAGYRPAIILSPARYNNLSSLALMCPITNQSKGFSFEVRLMEEMITSGVILSDQVKSFDWRSRRAKFVEKAPDALIEEVLAKLETLLG
ncbi:mRNA-degrading endonuclease [Phormidesmis priestleyi ULC007]|uniref:mRNA-degrading endonuclease n=1 Tax=Phormidesmis priestleyi ULC007 TaxID=1920490 RepID=A0A2T1DLA9_9CYAN|nr:endoribonuclease MazF [Phormidesmis priestleyi]PSB21262.1 mRNA-degrading endonuclease [Phormidesmis priestleyi ULC007]PZO50633.1 MAG: mRNA-degrading endonuclease [Phormidesmis priestleyi]